MPTKKYEWTEWDRCSTDELSEMMRVSGLSDRALSLRLDGAISNNRVRDLRLGLKAPVRLSEFLAICDVCHADPVTTLKRIIDRAEQIREEQAATPAAPSIDPTALADMDPDVLADLVAANQDEFEIAANEDPNKDLERETPRD